MTEHCTNRRANVAMSYNRAMEEDKSLPIRERLKMRALAKQAAEALRPLGLDAHTPRPWEMGDRVTVSSLETASIAQREHTGQSGIVTGVEYLGSFDPAKYEPGTFSTQRWNPAQMDPHADDFAIPVDPEKIEQLKQWDRLHDWRVSVRLDSGETVQLWPYHLTGELEMEQVINPVAPTKRPDLGVGTDMPDATMPAAGDSGISL